MKQKVKKKKGGPHGPYCGCKPSKLGYAGLTCPNPTYPVELVDGEPGHMHLGFSDTSPKTPLDIKSYRDDWHKCFDGHERFRFGLDGNYSSVRTKNIIVRIFGFVLRRMGYKSTIIKTKENPEYKGFYTRYFYQD